MSLNLRECCEAWRARTATATVPSTWLLLSSSCRWRWLMWRSEKCEEVAILMTLLRRWVQKMLIRRPPSKEIEILFTTTSTYSHFARFGNWKMSNNECFYFFQFYGKCLTTFSCVLPSVANTSAQVKPYLVELCWWWFGEGCMRAYPTMFPADLVNHSRIVVAYCVCRLPWMDGRENVWRDFFLHSIDSRATELFFECFLVAFERRSYEFRFFRVQVRRFEVIESINQRRRNFVIIILWIYRVV